MSLILDALKKLDREESAHRYGTTTITTEILKSGISPVGKRSPLNLAAIFLAAVAAVFITYTVTLKFGPPSGKLPLAAVAVKSPAPGRQVLPAPLAQEPSRGIRGGTGRGSVQNQNPAEGTNPVTSGNGKVTGRNAASEETGIAPRNGEKPVEHSSTDSPIAPPSLKVSGIMWTEEPSERCAVINGVMAREGTMIKEVKVVEILPGHVRFSYKGQTFEMSIRY
jgi:hypothetical protein